MQDDVNAHISRMLEGTLSLEVVHIIIIIITLFQNTKLGNVRGDTVILEKKEMGEASLQLVPSPLGPLQQADTKITYFLD